MTQLQFIQQVAIYGIQVGFWVAVAFPVVSAFFWPWWRHAWGMTIVALDVAIALALLVSVMTLEFGLVLGSTPGYVLAWTEAFSLWAIPAIIVWRAFLVFRTQRRGRGAPDPGGPPAD